MRHPASPRLVMALLSVAVGSVWSCEAAPKSDGSLSCSATEPCPDSMYCRSVGGGGGGCSSGGGGGGVCVPRRGRGESCVVGRIGWAETGRQSVCAEGLICHGGFSPPRCEPPSGPDEPCHDAADCGTGTPPAADALVCDVRSPPAPGLGRCAAPAGVAAGEACQEDRACEDGLACRPDPTGDPVCRGAGEEGDRCEGVDGLVPEDCADGLYCTWEFPRVCRPRHAAGEECTGGRDCEAGLVCRSEDGRCGEPSEEGGPCLEVRDCSAGLACAGDTCIERLPLGADCDTDAVCAVDLSCIGGACSPRSGEGGPCESHVQCLPPAWCSFGACRPVHPWSPPGGACRTSGDCLGERPCSGGVCRPRAGAGGSCSNDRDCVAGLFCGSERACRPRLAAGMPCGEEHECRSLVCDFTADPPACAP